MKKIILLSAICSLVILHSCVAPVNLQFESASMLEKGETEIQASGSTYYYDIEDGLEVTNRNVGYKFGYGISEEHNIKLRQEFLFVDQELVSVFSEIDNKFKMHKNFALSIPAGYYTNAKVVAVSPRIYMTALPSNHVDVTFIPKLNYKLDLITNESSLYPSFSFGMGFKSENNLWSFRPEVGWEGYLGYGFAITKKFKRPGQ